MLPYFLYIGVLLIELFLLALFTAYIFSLIYSHLCGSPFVPSKKKELELILSKCNLKKGMVFMDLGCGEGRVVRMAVKKYKVAGIGIDVNPLLLLAAKIFSRLEKLRSIKFERKNILTYDLSSADVIYIFLLPSLITKLVPHFERSLKNNTLVVSHGFKIPEWVNFATYKIDHLPFPTYYYRFKKRKN